MKHIPKKLLPKILVIAVMVATAFYIGKTLSTVNAAEKPEPTAVSVNENPEIKSLLRKLSMSAATENEEVPDFELLDMNGEAVRLSQFKGETVLLGFFTTW
jgi:cytochrome oxidase Cu insertion factor (SCO1/SenC/PrrC family)